MATECLFTFVLSFGGAHHVSQLRAADADAALSAWAAVHREQAIAGLSAHDRAHLLDGIEQAPPVRYRDTAGVWSRMLPLSEKRRTFACLTCIRTEAP